MEWKFWVYVRIHLIWDWNVPSAYRAAKCSFIPPLNDHLAPRRGYMKNSPIAILSLVELLFSKVVWYESPVESCWKKSSNSLSAGLTILIANQLVWFTGTQGAVAAGEEHLKIETTAWKFMNHISSSPSTGFMHSSLLLSCPTVRTRPHGVLRFLSWDWTWVRHLM